LINDKSWECGTKRMTSGPRFTRIRQNRCRGFSNRFTGEQANASKPRTAGQRICTLMCICD
jgi:hypothetical protein